MASRESAEHASIRRRKLERVQEEYRSFLPFLIVCMDLLGFGVTRVQRLIAAFLEFGPDKKMVQAQRGQAKTTITACYVVWRLIHNPALRVLVVSGGGNHAKDISILITRIISTLPELECMRPDTTMGDRDSVEAYDIHYSLRPVDKTASVACVGIFGNKTGKRADLLISDDSETPDNSNSAPNRERLLERTREFADLCLTNDIIYLGTPQSSDSIYNSLPARGYTIRIWPGRYPNTEQLPLYNGMLCPTLVRDMENHPEWTSGYGMDGSLGAAIDPQLLDDEKLYSKERDHGAARFQLQQMLLTALSDAQKRPLKTSNLIVAKFPDRFGKFPIEVHRGMDSSHLAHYTGAGEYGFTMSRPHTLSSEVSVLRGVVMYVDVAGGGKNGDETAYSVVGQLNGVLWVFAIGGLAGGATPDKLKALAAVAVKWKPDVVKIESNFGYGTFMQAFLPVLREAYKEAGIKEEAGVEDDYVTGQKEKRIIDTLEPAIGRGAVVINEDIVKEDVACSSRYGVAERKIYGVFFQMNHVTYDRDALHHDDRLDCLEGAVRHWQDLLTIDQTKAIAKLEAQRFKAWCNNPFGLRSKNAKPQSKSLLRK